MKSKLIAAAVLTALTLPVAAQAHTTRGELRHDAAQVREEKRELHRAKAHHNWREVREERRELSSAKREMREDLRDWRRTHHR